MKKHCCRYRSVDKTLLEASSSRRHQVNRACTQWSFQSCTYHCKLRAVIDVSCHTAPKGKLKEDAQKDLLYLQKGSLDFPGVGANHLGRDLIREQDSGQQNNRGTLVSDRIPAVPISLLPALVLR